MTYISRLPSINLLTEIAAPIELVFDLSRSIDLHKVSTEQTNETAIAGKTSGLIGLNESVTWRARHVGIYQKLTSRLTVFEPPTYFVDEMVDGAFKQFKHEHFFTEVKGATLMEDIFDYTSPLCLIGKLTDRLFLKNYMTKLLKSRNGVVKHFAESGRWKEILDKNASI